MKSQTKVTIKVTYNLKDTNDRERVDRIIYEKMGLIGVNFYAEGCELETQERDICYDFEIPNILVK